MSLHLLRSTKIVKNQILTLSATVEKNLSRAMRGFELQDIGIAGEVIDNDEEIDQMEVDLEEECLKTLALHQPVANDLRYIISVMKINNDLERIGDIAVNIAKTTFRLQKFEVKKHPFDLIPMEEKAREMLRASLDALVNRDTSLAHEVCVMDDIVDNYHQQNCIFVERTLAQDPSQLSVLQNYLQVSHKLERVGDHATNIAEDVIYCLEGKIVRHFTRLKEA